jgi:DNA repair exonuclease SbcCD ATPase subunit
MKLRLKNFRCYEDKSFDFGENGIVLINGMSGIGKSTILHAIYFVLYGIGIKVVKHGKTSCMVEMEYHSLIIKRTKNPNRLLVNNKYEDDVAQNILTEKFGKFFQLCSYISQNTINSFVMMNPSDKLTFLENFCFVNTNISNIKQKTKELIDDKYNNLQKITNELEVSIKILSEIEIPDKILFPIKCKKSQVDLVIKNEKIKNKKCKNRICKIIDSIENKKTECVDVKLLEQKLSNITKNNDNLKSRLDIISKNIEENFIDDNLLENVQVKIDFNKHCKLIYQKKKEYNDKQLFLKNIQKNEEKEYNDKIIKYKSDLWKEYDEKELETLLVEYEEYYYDMKEYEKNTRRIREEYEKKISYDMSFLNIEKCEKILDEKQKLLQKIIIRKNTYKCPCCQNVLYMNNGSLKILPENEIEKEINVEMEKNVEKEINTIKLKLENYYQEIRNLNYDTKLYETLVKNNNDILKKYDEQKDSTSIKKILNELHYYKNEQINKISTIKKLQSKLDNKVYSSTYNNVLKTLEELEKEINKLNTTKECVIDDIKKIDYNIEKYKLQFYKETEKKNKLLSLKKEYNLLNDEILKNDKEYVKIKNEHIKIYDKISPINNIQKDLGELKENMNKENMNKEKHEHNLKIIEKWEKYNIELKNYKKWENKITELKKEQIICQKYYNASKLLKEKIFESESIALYNMINSLNSYVKTYLDMFFVDEPISIILKPFKKTKTKVKTQLNFEIVYKNMDCNLNMLSGGEVSRVILAYTLALSEMTNSPLLLLDECTSSLDQELTGDVFEVIKDNFKNKTVIFIAHQIVTGQFDKIINL